jgi:plasmid stabilization system protein ParE
VRELVHGRYIIVYRLDDVENELIVLSVIHGSRLR